MVKTDALPRAALVRIGADVGVGEEVADEDDVDRFVGGRPGGRSPCPRLRAE